MQTVLHRHSRPKQQISSNQMYALRLTEKFKMIPFSLGYPRFLWQDLILSYFGITDNHADPSSQACDDDAEKTDRTRPAC